MPGVHATTMLTVNKLNSRKPVFLFFAVVTDLLVFVRSQVFLSGSFLVTLSILIDVVTPAGPTNRDLKVL